MEQQRPMMNKQWIYLLGIPQIINAYVYIPQSQIIQPTEMKSFE